MIPRIAGERRDVPFVYPDSLVRSAREDYELGGVALGDASQPLNLYAWRGYGAAGVLYLQNLTTGAAPVPVHTYSGALKTFSFAFTQSMQPVLAWTDDLGVWLRRYDEVTQQDTVLTVPGRTPRLSLDEKRPLFISDSDVLLAYIRDATLYYTLQRDSFSIESGVATDVPAPARLLNIGRNVRNEFQFAVG